jgi:hypothetical protein
MNARTRELLDELDREVMDLEVAVEELARRSSSQPPTPPPPSPEPNDEDIGMALAILVRG